MRANASLKIMAVVVSLLSLSGCIVKDSPAPGCIETIGLPAAGGCLGKTAILDLKVTGPECVSVAVNNCNGGVLEIRNHCPEALQLNGVEIPASAFAILDVTETEAGFRPVEIYNNFSSYTPDADRQVRVDGAVGDQTFVVVFTKTKPLCK